MAELLRCCAAPDRRRRTSRGSASTAPSPTLHDTKTQGDGLQLGHDDQQEGAYAKRIIRALLYADDAAILCKDEKEATDRLCSIHTGALTCHVPSAGGSAGALVLVALDPTANVASSSLKRRC